MADIEFLSTRQAALRLGVSLGTVQNMVESGALEAWKTAGGHRRIPVTSIAAVLARRKGATTTTPGSQLDILITEDDARLRTLYRDTFERWNLPLQLRIVDNGFAGLLEIGQKKPEILITDLSMSGMDGFEMICHLRANPDYAAMDIIVISTVGQKEITHQDFPANITFFGKPIPFHELKGFMLGRLAAHQRPIGH
jgi:excisionase family DNA binding protein